MKGEGSPFFFFPPSFLHPRDARERPVFSFGPRQFLCRPLACFSFPPPPPPFSLSPSPFLVSGVFITKRAIFLLFFFSSFSLFSCVQPPSWERGTAKGVFPLSPPPPPPFPPSFLFSGKGELHGTLSPSPFFFSFWQAFSGRHEKEKCLLAPSSSTDLN